MDINSVTPYREGTYPIFTSVENGCEHIGNNKNKHHIRHYRVDGGVIPPNSPEARCDYLLLNDTDLRAYYIELKGSDLKKAIQQIENTISLLQGSISNYRIFKRIVYHTGTHSIHDNPVIRWKKDNIQVAIIQHRRIEEDIS